MTDLPRRWTAPGILPSLLFAGFVGVLAWSLATAGISPMELAAGTPWMVEIVQDMVPPDTSRLGSMLHYTWVTVQMAVVGTFLGVLFSIPLGFLAAANHSPHVLVQQAVRGLIGLFRSVPDLVWALFFIASVGLGPQSGTLAIMIDTMGFCGRFFAEHLEEVDPAPGEALACIGAGKVDVLASATLPAAMPAMTGTSLFAFEKAVRSSMILGLVGAGGIGVELSVAMEMGYFDQAATIIIIIFIVILLVEQLSSRVRRRLLAQGGR